LFMAYDGGVSVTDEVAESVERLRAIAREIAAAQKTVNTLTVQRQQLIEQLKDAGISITEIAREAGLTAGRVHQLLNAKRPATARLLAREADAVGIIYAGDGSAPGELILRDAADLVAETARGVKLDATVRSDLPTPTTAQTQTQMISWQMHSGMCAC